MEVILMQGQNKISGQSDQPVPNLYTPRTVNFTPPPLGDAKDSQSSPGDGKGGRDKTYRLFVVSMEA